MSLASNKLGFSNGRHLGMGWIRDLPDIRDYLPFSKEIKDLLPVFGSLAPTIDLRCWCSPIKDQGALNSSAAHAVLGLLEHFQNKSFGKNIDGSRLFLYKTSRNLMGNIGDSGASIRTTLAALLLFGVPPECYWPYEISKFDIEPPNFCYGYSKFFKSIIYYRLDSTNLPKCDLLKVIKLILMSGIPLVFGFTVYSSISQAFASGKIPMPSMNESVLGGQCVAVIGYDDSINIKNNITGKETTGALLIRNSWGASWGDRGYGWLPYDYVLQGLVGDCWCITRPDWIDTGQFGLYEEKIDLLELYGNPITPPPKDF